ncbi:MAG: lipopolysaccharide export system permease protein [Cellvibrionaceae bacterium]|jgi:lipopolysaccharide export system permease protein
MRLLDRYLFSAVFVSILMVLLVMCALDFLGKLIGELEDLDRQYTFTEALLYVSLSIPLSIYQYMPFAVLIGVLVGLGNLSASSELIAIRAAGVSLLQITLAVIKPTILLISLTLLLAEYLIPISERYAENRRAVKLHDTNSLLVSRQGWWNREGDEFIHINRLEYDGRIRGITRYRYNDNRLVASSFSESAIYVDGRWVEKAVVETIFSGKRIQRQEYASRIWDIDLSPALLAALVEDSGKLSISNLYRYVSYLSEQNIASGRHQLVLWSKVFQPAAIIGLVLIAVSFIFGPLRDATMGYRIFTGVLAGIVFQLAQKLFGPASLVYGFPPLFAVLLPIVFCFVAGFYLLVRK